GRDRRRLEAGDERARLRALRAAALVGELARRLLPGAVDLAQQVVLRDEGVGEHHLVEVLVAAHLADRVDADARGLHVDQELRQAVAAVVRGRRRSAEEAQHVVGLMRVARPDLGAVQDEAAARGHRPRLRREEIRSRAGLAPADAEAELAAADARPGARLYGRRCL